MPVIAWIIVIVFVGSYVLSKIFDWKRKIYREHFINERGLIVNVDDKSLTYNKRRIELKKIKNHYVVKDGWEGILIIETDDKVIPEIRIVVPNADFGVRGATRIENNLKQAIEWSNNNTPEYKIDQYIQSRYS